SEIGITDNSGSNRPGYSPLEKQAKEKIQDWMNQSGFNTYIDNAGNVIGRFDGIHNHLSPIACRSLVDTIHVRHHFDGVLGILTALEVVEAWKSEGRKLKHPFEIIVFSDEEGTRFNTGMTGSKSMMGEVSTEKLKRLTDDDNVTFEEALQTVDLHI